MELKRVDNPRLVYKIYQAGKNGNMNNFEVAKMFTINAIAYGRWRHRNDADKVETLMANLEKIEEWLKNPMDINDEYDWSDFR